MEQMLCDIHMHLIPGVDDGAMDMRTAEAMLLGSLLQGTRAIFATPHHRAEYPYRDETARKNFQALEELVQTRYPEIKLYQGCEVYCSVYSMEETTAKLRDGLLPTMNGTEYVLAEFSTGIQADELRSCTQALLDAGFIPIIAHIERYTNLTCADAKRLREKGCRIQINLDSLLSRDDSRIRELAQELCTGKLADFLGTDAHDTGSRPPAVEDGINWLRENCDENYIHDIAWENARKYLRIKTG